MAVTLKAHLTLPSNIVHAYTDKQTAFQKLRRSSQGPQSDETNTFPSSPYYVNGGRVKNEVFWLLPQT